MRWIVIMLVLLVASPSRADIDCQNHDQLPDVKPEQFLRCRHADHAKIRAAARRFCARATGRRDRCERIKPLLARCRCPIELHRVGDDGHGKPESPYAWLGGDPEGNELFWGVELRVTKRGWVVTDVFFDDYERP